MQIEYKNEKQKLATLNYALDLYLKDMFEKRAKGETYPKTKVINNEKYLKKALDVISKSTKEKEKFSDSELDAFLQGRLSNIRFDDGIDKSIQILSDSVSIRKSGAVVDTSLREPDRVNQLFIYYKYNTVTGGYDYLVGEVDSNVSQRLYNNYDDSITEDKKNIEGFFLSDAVNVNGDNINKISKYKINDSFSDIYKFSKNKYIPFKRSKLAHRDGIQIIYNSDDINDPRDRYSASETRSLNFENNTIISKGKMQGIFSSDGLHRKISFKDNVIETDSGHKISVNGLLSGYFENNTNKTKNGDFVEILLEPLRLAGGKWINVYVLGFADKDGNTHSDYKYGELQKGEQYVENKVTYKEKDALAFIVDSRKDVPLNAPHNPADKRRKGVGILNFPIESFISDYRDKTVNDLMNDPDNDDMKSNFKCLVESIIEVYNRTKFPDDELELSSFGNFKIYQLNNPSFDSFSGKEFLEKYKFIGERLRWACIKELGLKYTIMNSYPKCKIKDY